MADHGLRPIIEGIEQDTLDVAKVFKLLSTVDVGKRKAIDVFFTETGEGYLNALASLNPKLFVVREDIYLELQSKYNSKIEEYKKTISNFYQPELEKLNENNISLKDECNKLKACETDNTKNYAERFRLISENEELSIEITRLKQTIDNLRKPNWWEFWK